MKIKAFSRLGFLILFGVLLLSINGCCPPFCGPSNEQDVVCSKRGVNSLFVATFDADTVGSLPAPSMPLRYGPPGAGLDLDGDANTIEVINSAELGSKALKITRSQGKHTKVDAVTGDIGDGAHVVGTYYIDFRAYGEIVPQNRISGTAISVMSAEDHEALTLKLFDGAYHLLQGNSSDRLTGSYDPTRAHSVHIELNMDDRKFSICINDEVVAADKAFAQNDFTNLKLIRFLAPQTITEAFQNISVFDDVRITK